MRTVPIVALCLLAACVPVDEIKDLDSRPSQQAALRPDGSPFALLDPGAAELTSLHFKIRAYGQEQARLVADQAEASYNRIMIDTNLFSFQPRELYEIVVYATQQEYRAKTGQPEWSGGCSVGRAIYTYNGPQLPQILAHEMTHLIWHEFMGRVNMDHRWVNEGLAVYQELKAAGASSQDPFSIQRGTLRQTPLTFDQLVHLIPATERERNVALWYAQSQSMVKFLIERGGRMGFSQFLHSLRDGRPWDEAVATAFPGVWRTMADVEQGWQRSLQ